MPIGCGDCGRQVSERLPYCPSCGAPMGTVTDEGSASWLRPAILGSVCVVLIGMLACLVGNVPDRVAFGVQALGVGFGVFAAIIQSWPHG